MNRIAIIGYAGSGKSTLTQQLHHLLHLPAYHLDQYFWKPNWGRPDPDEYKKIHDSLCEQEQWIMDGINVKHLEYRIVRADIIIFLDIPWHICLYRIFKRTFIYYGKVTPSSAPECPERINWEFIRFLKWMWNFKRLYLSRITELLSTYSEGKKIYIIKSQQDLNDMIKQLTSN